MSSYPPIVGTPAEIYEQHMVPAIFTHWAPDLVEAAGVQPGGCALDAACGTGVVTRLLAERVGSTGRVVGLDINPGMLAVARSAAPSPNIAWIEGNAVNVTLPDATFDYVLCQQGLQFFLDKPAAMAEMRRVLKSGGRLALSCWFSVKYIPGYLALEQALAKHVGPQQAALPPFSLGDADTLRHLVTSAGFHTVRLRIDSKMIRFQSAEHMVRATVAGAPTMLGALAAQGDGVLDAIIDDVDTATRAYVDDEVWAIPAISHIVTATA